MSSTEYYTPKCLLQVLKNILCSGLVLLHDSRLQKETSSAREGFISTKLKTKELLI